MDWRIENVDLLLSSQFFFEVVSVFSSSRRVVDNDAIIFNRRHNAVLWILEQSL